LRMVKLFDYEAEFNYNLHLCIRLERNQLSGF